MLESRALPFQVPRYSLTGDVLAHQRCGLQYRYYNASSLPPSRPVQMWTGEFLHGVLEEAYRLWKALSPRPDFPWPSNPSEFGEVPPRERWDIGEIGARIEAQLAAAGKRPRSGTARLIAYRRAESAVNILGPDLFPLITAAEEKLSGTREMPHIPMERPTRGDRYELTGVVDVISSVALASSRENRLVRKIGTYDESSASAYDLIVDYKGMRRPCADEPVWQYHEWQVQTYAWLRARDSGSPPVRAGLIVYLNELYPSRQDFSKLKRELQEGRAEVSPERGSTDYYAIERWDPRLQVPLLSDDFRLNRALRMIDVAGRRVENAVMEIDRVVGLIEASAIQEYVSGDILATWPATGGEEDCVACDFKHICPNPASVRHNLGNRNPPEAPG